MKILQMKVRPLRDRVRLGVWATVSSVVEVESGYTIEA